MSSTTTCCAPDAGRRNATRRAIALWLCCCLAAAGAHAGDEVGGLHELAEFPIGVAVPAAPWPHSLLDSPERQALVNRHFDSLTAENNMKMKYLQPERGKFTFAHADALVDYAERHGMRMHGHVLVWHTQVPEWMNELEGTAEEFAAVLDAHVGTVAGHFRGRVQSWDVVNEAFLDEVPVEYRPTIWYENLGPGYIERAFRRAHEVAPDADLYYNDYDISGSGGPHKLDRILEMADDFLERDVPIDGIGFQMHIDTESPTREQMQQAFANTVARGLKVRISELDVSVNVGAGHTEFSEELAESQRRRYEQVVRAYLETVPAELRGGITVWGITDADSWIPDFRDRPDWPLLFDADYRPKPALRGMAEGLSGAAPQ